MRLPRPLEPPALPSPPIPTAFQGTCSGCDSARWDKIDTLGCREPVVRPRRATFPVSRIPAAILELPSPWGHRVPWATRPSTAGPKLAQEKANGGAVRRKLDVCHDPCLPPLQDLLDSESLIGAGVCDVDMSEKDEGNGRSCFSGSSTPAAAISSIRRLPLPRPSPRFEGSLRFHLVGGATLMRGRRREGVQEVRAGGVLLPLLDACGGVGPGRPFHIAGHGAWRQGRPTSGS